MNEIVLDTDTPSGRAHLLDTNGNVFLQHGGVATRLEYRDVVQMDLNTFVRLEVPKLKKQSEDLYVIRNSAAGAYTFILGDQVIKYNIEGCTEVRLNSLIEYLTSDKDEVVTPNLPWPLVAKVVSNRETTITVELPPERHRYVSPTIDVDTMITTPRLWFRCSFSAAGAFSTAGVAVVKERASVWSDTNLGRWPLPNVHCTTDICFGHVVLPSGVRGGELTVESQIATVIDMFFNSNWNTDLVISNSADAESLLGNAYDTLAPRKDYWEPKIRRAGADIRECTLMRILAVLENEKGYKALNYLPTEVSTSKFVRLRRNE